MIKKMIKPEIRVMLSQAWGLQEPPGAKRGKGMSSPEIWGKYESAIPELHTCYLQNCFSRKSSLKVLTRATLTHQGTDWQIMVSVFSHPQQGEQLLTFSSDTGDNHTGYLQTLPLQLTDAQLLNGIHYPKYSPSTQVVGGILFSSKYIFLPTCLPILWLI